MAIILLGTILIILMRMVMSYFLFEESKENNIMYTNFWEWMIVYVSRYSSDVLDIRDVGKNNENSNNNP